MHAWPAEVSGGEAQRAAVARACAGDRTMIFADEPTGSLDSDSGRNVLEIFQALVRRSGTATLMVTHDADAAAIADRKMVMSDGRLEGGGAQITQRGVFIARSFARAWGRHPLRSCAALFGVTMGVALTALVVTISTSVSEAVRGAVGSELVDADIAVSARLPNGMGPDASRRIFAAAQGAVAVPVLQVNTRLSDHGGPSLSILGVPDSARSLVPKFDPAGLKTVRPARGTAGLLLGQHWAEEHDVRRGSVIGVIGPGGAQPWTVIGLVNTALPNGGAVGVTGIGTARVAFARRGKTDVVYIQTPPSTSTASLETRLRAAAGGAAVVGASNVSSRADEASLLAIRGVLIGVGLLGLAAAALVVFVSWRLMLQDERRNISRFLLSGATLADLAVGSGVVMFAATLVCAVLGVAIGIGLAEVLNTVTQRIAGFTGLAAVPSTRLSPAAVVVGFASAFAMTGAAWLAGIRAMQRVPIIEAFLVERPDLSGGSRLRRLFLVPIVLALIVMVLSAIVTPVRWNGLALGAVVACACLLAYCIPIGLASLVERMEGFFPLAVGRYMTAHSRRVSLLTITFGVGIAISIILGGLIVSFDRGLSRSVDSWTKADVFVRPDWAGSTMRDTLFPGSQRARLARIDGVERAGAWTSTRIEEDGHQILLEGWDTNNTSGIVNLIVYDGPQGQALWRALARGEVAISQNMSRLRDLGVGDRLEIPTPSGTGTLRVAAVVDDYLSERGAIIASLGTFRRVAGDSRIESIQLKLEPGANQAAVARQVRALLPGRPNLVIASREEMRHRITGFFDSLVFVLGGLTVAVFALVLLVAITTTAASLNARRKFLGLSVLCGAEPRAIRQQLIAEGLLIGAAAWLAGAPAGVLSIGLAIGTLSLVTGLTPAVVLPVWIVALTLPLALAASSAAVWLPARRLPREIVDTIRFE